MFTTKDWKMFKRGAAPEAGKWVVRAIFLVIALIVTYFLISYFLATPGRVIGGVAESVGGAIGSAWDYLPDFIPGADDANAPAETQPAAEQTPTPVIVSAEPNIEEENFTCGWITKFNPLCD